MLSESLKSLIKAFGLDLLVMSLLDVVKGHSKAQVEKMLQGWILGIGIYDEILFQAACAHAVLRLGVSIDNLNKVIDVIKTFPEGVRSRIVQIIGKSEEEIPVQEPMMKDGSVVVDKKGNTVYTKVTRKANVRGGETILLMSRMSPDEIRNFLVQSGATNTVGARIGRASDNLSNIWQIASSSPVVKNFIGNTDTALTSLERAMNNASDTPIKDFFNYLTKK